jgi:hypothetical protein
MNNSAKYDLDADVEEVSSRSEIKRKLIEKSESFSLFAQVPVFSFSIKVNDTVDP